MTRGAFPWPLAERWLVILVALHSVGVGTILLVVPEQGVRFGGWPGAEPLFFVLQAGVFHFVLAAGYLLEHVRYRGISLLVVAKFSALVFLTACWITMDVPWSVPFSGFADGAMGLAALVVHRLARDA